MEPVAALPLASAFASSGLAQLPQAALLTAVFSAIAAALATLFAARIARRQISLPAYGSLMNDGTAFLFSGENLWLASDAGQDLLAGEQARSSKDALVQVLARRGCDLRSRLDRLLNEGTPFRVETKKEDGTVWMVEGAPRGAMAGVTIRDLTKTEIRSQSLLGQVEKLTAKREHDGMVLNAAPFAAWHVDTDGRILWSNDTYNRLVREDPKNAAHLAEALDSAGASDETRFFLQEGPRTLWYELQTRPVAEKETLAFAHPADRLVATEDALHRFVATLTGTFAHLSVGLAVFDGDRRLHIFNPALSDLTGLKPAWLAARPTMHDVFDRLNEHRIMPVQSDFEQFRATLARIEEGAATGELSETWSQPTGRTFRITGRPHPKNAVAIMLEDISDTVTLERQYRSEIQLGQAALDCISDAVAVFDLAGRMTFANVAFARLWSLPPDWRDGERTLSALAEHCGTRTCESSFWSDLQDFATAAEDRQGWPATIALIGGPTAKAQVEPMPNGSTLLLFNLGEARAADTAGKTDGPAVLLDWTTNLFREALLEAANRLGAESPLADGLLIAVRQGDAALRHQDADKVLPAAAIHSLHRQLSALVADRGQSIDLEIDNSLDAADLPPAIRNVTLALLLAVKSLSAPRARLNVTLTSTPDSTNIIVSTFNPMGLSRDGSVPDRLPLRILSRLTGGTAQVQAVPLEDGSTGLMLRLPHAAPQLEPKRQATSN